MDSRREHEVHQQKIWRQWGYKLPRVGGKRSKLANMRKQDVNCNKNYVKPLRNRNWHQRIHENSRYFFPGRCIVHVVHLKSRQHIQHGDGWNLWYLQQADHHDQQPTPMDQHTKTCHEQIRIFPIWQWWNLVFRKQPRLLDCKMPLLDTFEDSQFCWRNVSGIVVASNAWELNVMPMIVACISVIHFKWEGKKVFQSNEFPLFLYGFLPVIHWWHCICHLHSIYVCCLRHHSYVMDGMGNPLKLACFHPEHVWWFPHVKKNLIQPPGKLLPSS